MKVWVVLGFIEHDFLYIFLLFLFSLFFIIFLFYVLFFIYKSKKGHNGEK
jgi:hypothetical protein